MEEINMLDIYFDLDHFESKVVYVRLVYFLFSMHICQLLIITYFHRLKANTNEWVWDLYAMLNSPDAQSKLLPRTKLV